MDTRAGAMYEINALAWPVVYGFAGHVWGAAMGHPWLGVAAGIVAGMATAVPMMRASFYDVEIVAPLLLFGLLLVPAWSRRWYLLAICILPWIRLGLSGLMHRGREKAADPSANGG
jgi:hypothetical protein